MVGRDKYLVGTKVLHARLDNDIVMVRVGGGYNEFEKYITKH